MLSVTMSLIDILAYRLDHLIDEKLNNIETKIETK